MYYIVQRSDVFISEQLVQSYLHFSIYNSDVKSANHTFHTVLLSKISMDNCGHERKHIVDMSVVFRLRHTSNYIAC